MRSDDLWFFYRIDDKGKTTLINLLSAWISAGEQMITADKANSIILEWLFRDIMFKVDDCVANQGICRAKIAKIEAM